MDMLDDDLLEFWGKLNELSVRYIMIGGLAVRFQGFNRITDDLDLWLEDTPDNRKKLRKAFDELQYGDYPEIETMQFVAGWTSFYAAGMILDIITEMKGLEHLSFSDCYEAALITDIEDVQIRSLHLNHLIMNKKVVDRPKDKLDVIYLEKLKRLKGLE